MPENKRKKSRMSYEDEIAWQERKRQMKEEKKLEKISEEEKKGGLANIEEKTMQRCYFLFSVIKKYLTINNGDFSIYDRLYRRYNYLVNNCLGEQYGAWKDLHDKIKIYIHDVIGYDNIKIYLPKDIKIPKVKYDAKTKMNFLIQNFELFSSLFNEVEGNLKNDEVTVNKAIQDKLSQKD